MKQFLFALALLFPIQATAGGFVLGSGRWTCGEIIRVYEGGTAIEKGQMAGWILGYWSAATFEREDAFVDIVESVGGSKILEASVAECRRVPADTLLYRITKTMIQNTR